MSSQVIVYSVYTAVAVSLIVWLARTLGHHGGTFLADVFPESPALAKSINQLLVTGFFMLNLGYAAYLMDANFTKESENGADAFEILAGKLGTLLISLAIFHFINMIVFWKIRRHRMLADMAPPVAPAMSLPNPGYPSGYGTTYAAPTVAYATPTDFSATVR